MFTFNELLKKLGAGLLTFVVVGGVGGLLALSLISTKPAADATKIQAMVTSPMVESVMVTGEEKRAS